MWLDVQIFGLRALWSPYFALFVLSLGVAYFLITGPYRGSHHKPTIKQQLFFYSGLILLYVVKGSPVDLLSHIMLSAHMLQMALLYLAFPIFIIRGIPNWIWEKVIQFPVVDKIFAFFTKPLMSLLVFNSLFAIYHVPAIFDYSKSSQFAHVLISLILLITAFFMWWPIITPLKEENRMNPLVKMAHLIVSTLIISIACALIIFSYDPMYRAYSSEGAWIQAMSLCVPQDVLTGLAPELSGAEMFSPLTTMEDQQLGGIIMMFLQQIIYGIVLAWIFFSWFSKKNLETDPLPSSMQDTH